MRQGGAPCLSACGPKGGYPEARFGFSDRRLSSFRFRTAFVRTLLPIPAANERQHKRRNATCCGLAGVFGFGVPVQRYRNPLSALR